jgi:hypothetical protein
VPDVVFEVDETLKVELLIAEETTLVVKLLVADEEALEDVLLNEAAEVESLVVEI